MKRVIKRHMSFLFVSLVTGMLFCGSATAATDSRKRVGSVALVNGQVIIRSGAITFPAEPGSPVYEGDVVRTYNPAKVKLVFADDTVMNAGHDTEFTIRKAYFSLDKRESLFEVARGRFKVAVGKFFTGTDNIFRLRTPTVVAGVRGTVFWGDTELDAFCTLEGEVETYPVSNDRNRRSLTAGNCVAEMAKGNLTPISPTGAAVKAYIDEVTPQ